MQDRVRLKQSNTKKLHIKVMNLLGHRNVTVHVRETDHQTGKTSDQKFLSCTSLLLHKIFSFNFEKETPGIKVLILPFFF